MTLSTEVLEDCMVVVIKDKLIREMDITTISVHLGLQFSGAELACLSVALHPHKL